MFDQISGLFNGIGHTEIILRDGKVYVIESHIRAGGDGIPELIENVKGYSPYQMLYNILRNDGNMRLSLKNNKKSSIKFYIPEKGVIKKVNFEPSDFDFSPYIKDRLFLKEGIDTKDINNSVDRKCGYVVAKNTDEPVEIIDDYFSQYKVVYKRDSK